MQRIEVKIKGISPLLQGKFPLEQFLEERVVKKKKANSLNDAEESVYKNGEGFYCPSTYLEGALRSAGKSFKTGRKSYASIVSSQVYVEPEEIPLETSGWKPFIRVVVNHNMRSARVPCNTPRFNDWSLTFQLLVEDDALASDTLKRILEYAGVHEGIGVWRPNLQGKFGKFIVEEWKLL